MATSTISYKVSAITDTQKSENDLVENRDFNKMKQAIFLMLQPYRCVSSESYWKEIS